MQGLVIVANFEVKTKKMKKKLIRVDIYGWIHKEYI